MSHGVRLKKAFTLIELLVVIAVVALLMSILMPGLQRAKKAAQRVVCGSNLKQIGTGLSLYLAHNNDRMPLFHARWEARYADQFGASNGQYSWWPNEDILGHYVMSQSVTGTDEPRYDSSVFYCAVNSGPAKRFIKSQNLAGTSQSLHTTYAANLYLQSYYDTQTRRWHHARSAQFKNPARTPVLYDAFWLEGYEETGAIGHVVPPLSVPSPGWPKDTRSYSASFMPGVPNAHKDGTSNFLFLDGHIDTIREMKTYQEYQEKFTWHGTGGKPDWVK